MTPPRSILPRLLSTWLPVVLFAGLIVYFSSRTVAELPKLNLPHFDAIAHFGEYTVLAMLCARALVRSGFAPGRALWLAVLTASLFGVTDEFHQSFVPGRQGDDWRDLVADAVGAIVGAVAWTAGGGRRLAARNAP